MNRRTLLAALGAVGAGGAVVTSTGAFTSVEAERDVTVQVADDAAALLRIDNTGNHKGEYTSEADGEFGIDLTGTSEGAKGVNTNATTVIADLFEIQNQGTQEIEVEVTPLSFVDTDAGDTLIVLVVPETSFPTVTLGVGDTETYSLVVDVFPGGTDLGVSDTITVSGVAT